ncbi:type II toxin-antitoxin system RelE/ParE family toxin [Nonomuraea harbinensis]|uniref:Type II toxin-antitoxin system RelE/ParE family toxin n=1 Tax=Nonomuraea harbinensis TaxID=1286938 RepID=A0ABW1BL01_9ACTN|nr:type II toxin-antitoxin system RelE/ParE family toxin [Nonomuraea harbinensis]
MQDEWGIYVTDEVDAWISGLDPEAHRLVIDALDRLAENGPALGRPLVGKMNGSRIANLKELCPRSTGRSALRLLFVFDPRRDAIVPLPQTRSRQALAIPTAGTRRPYRTQSGCTRFT